MARSPDPYAAAAAGATVGALAMLWLGVLARLGFLRPLADLVEALFPPFSTEATGLLAGIVWGAVVGAVLAGTVAWLLIHPWHGPGRGSFQPRH